VILAEIEAFFVAASGHVIGMFSDVSADAVDGRGNLGLEVGRQWDVSERGEALLSDGDGRLHERLDSLTDLSVGIFGADDFVAGQQDWVGARRSGFVLGIIVAFFLVDRVGRIKLQIVGFIGAAVGLLLSGLSMRPGGTNVMWLLFLGFTLFYFMVNFGPNAMTYLLAGEVFPTEVRGKGAGFAASFAKIGAVLTAFLFPILLKTIGTTALLWGLVVCFLLGAIVTYLFRIETVGVNLEDVGK
jgi:MFS family permease